MNQPTWLWLGDTIVDFQDRIECEQLDQTESYPDLDKEGNNSQLSSEGYHWDGVIWQRQSPTAQQVACCLAVGCILRDLGSNAISSIRSSGSGLCFFHMRGCVDEVQFSRVIWSIERQNRKSMLNRSAVVSILKSQVKSRAELVEKGGASMVGGCGVWNWAEFVSWAGVGRPTQWRLIGPMCTHGLERAGAWSITAHWGLRFGTPGPPLVLS
jgi:hypothetical protein